MSSPGAPPVLLIGSAGHACVVADAVERQGTYQLVGFIDSYRPPGEGPIGYPVLGSDDDLEPIIDRHGIQGLVVAIGDNWNRARVAQKLLERKLPMTFPSIIHPAAAIARTATIGEGSVVLAGAVVNSRASVGRWCIVNTRSSLDHDSSLGDFASLAPGATIGGNTKIGAYTAISLGAAVIHGIGIGEHTVIGAGATVVKSIPDYVVAYGTPARVRRSRIAGEPYL